MANEVLRAANRRNHKILLVLGLRLFSDVAWHLAELGNNGLLQEWTRAQLWLVILLICAIGGRIIPAFTGNWLRRQAAETITTEQARPLATILWPY